MTEYPVLSNNNETKESKQVIDTPPAVADEDNVSDETRYNAGCLCPAWLLGIIADAAILLKIQIMTHYFFCVEL